MTITITPSPYVTSAGVWYWHGAPLAVYGLPVLRFGVWYAP